MHYRMKAGPRRGIQRGRMIAGQEASLQLSDPAPALGGRDIGVFRERALDRGLVELFVVQAPEFRRQPAQRAHKRKLCAKNITGQPERHFLQKASECSVSRWTSDSGSPAINRLALDWMRLVPQPHRLGALGDDRHVGS